MNFQNAGNTAPKMYTHFKDFTKEEQATLTEKFSKNGDVKNSFFRKYDRYGKTSFAMYAGGFTF